MKHASEIPTSSSTPPTTTTTTTASKTTSRTSTVRRSPNPAPPKPSGLADSKPRVTPKISPGKTAAKVPQIKLKTTASIVPGNGSKKAAAKATATAALPAKPRASLSSTRTAEAALRRPPVRDVYDPRGVTSSSHISKQQQPTKNAMSSVHNVTVLSPPATPQKASTPPPRNIAEALQWANNQVVPSTAAPRERTRTHTLGADEVLVLGKLPAQLTTLNPATPATIVSVPQQPTKEPVAFEITFDEDSKPTAQQVQEAEEDEYEDDFDSYESDFESCSSTGSAPDADNSQSTSQSSETEDEDDAQSEGSRPHAAELADEETAKLLLAEQPETDSGMYDWKGIGAGPGQVLVAHLGQSDNQMDSGFGLSVASPTPKPTGRHPAAPGAASQSAAANARRKRATALLAKITLDTMSYTLFSLKPIPYAQYMRLFGHHNRSQLATQTAPRGIAQDSQTEAPRLATVWTQHPAEFAARTRSQQDAGACGRVEAVERHAIIAEDGDGGAEDEAAILLEACLGGLARFDDRVVARGSVDGGRPGKPVDFVRMRAFLQQSAVTIEAICRQGDEGKRRGELLDDKESLRRVPFSKGYRRIVTEDNPLLRDSRVQWVTAGNDTPDCIVYSVHSRERGSMIAVWNKRSNSSSSSKGPEDVLWSWGEVRCLEPGGQEDGLIFGGLADGFIAVWNRADPRCLSAAGHRLPFQLIAPTHNSDCGAVVAIHCLRTSSHATQSPPQLFSLHENGLLTDWSVLPCTGLCSKSASIATTADPPETPVSLAHLAPWSRHRLSQTALLDMSCAGQGGRPHRPQSSVAQTRALFESNLLTDRALQELQQMNSGPAAGHWPTQLRCGAMIVTAEAELFVATNRAHLLYCTRSLHPDAVREIRVAADGQQQHPTSLVLVPEARAIVVGMSDGSVRVVSGPEARRDTDAEHMAELLVDDRDLSASAAQWNVSAKSCAIQSIIEEERTPPSRRPSSEQEEEVVRAEWATTTLAADDALRHPLRRRNQMQLMAGVSGRGNAVRWIAHSATGNRLWIRLAGGDLRVFDCGRMDEVGVADDEEAERSTRAGGIVACCLTSAGEARGAEKLTLLTTTGDVQVHSLRNP